MPVNKKRPFRTNLVVLRAATATAVVAGILCFVVSSLLIVNYWQVSTLDPMNKPELLRLRAQLTSSPEADATAIEQYAPWTCWRAPPFLQTSACSTPAPCWRCFRYCIRHCFACCGSNRPHLRTCRRPAAAVFTGRIAHAELLVFMGGLWLLAALLATALTQLDIPIPTTELHIPGTGTASDVCTQFTNTCLGRNQKQWYFADRADTASHIIPTHPRTDGASRQMSLEDSQPCPVQFTRGLGQSRYSAAPTPKREACI